jgi:isocitrate/isopropylmalate dehydrogenase
LEFQELERGYYIPEGGLELLRTHDAVLFGAVGSPGTFFLPEREIQYLRNPFSGSA